MWVDLSPPPPHSPSPQPHPTSKSRNTSTTLPKTGSRLLRPAIPKWLMASSHYRMDQVSASHWTKRSFASIHDSRYFSICSPKTGTVARRNAQQPRSNRRKKIETRVNLSLASTHKPHMYPVGLLARTILYSQFAHFLDSLQELPRK